MRYHNYKNKPGNYYSGGRSETTGRFYTRQIRPKYYCESTSYMEPIIHILMLAIVAAYLLFR